MPRLRHEMAAADQLDGVDVLLRQQAADADGERHRDDARHHQVVVARHFENHGDGGHGGAGAAADHGGHADDGAGGDAESRLPGMTALTARPKAPPIVAPMNSDGEKMPPEAPEPRLTEVAQSLAANSKHEQRRHAEVAVEDRLDGRIADALDVIVAAADQQRVDQHADHQHADDVAQVGVLDELEYVFGVTEAATKTAAASPITAPSRA